ncbi:hypothetical protein JW905_08800 [bacterium]|nr:hypothetical protein [candidate division CSSED10-310 bacterium]
MKAGKESVMKHGIAPLAALLCLLPLACAPTGDDTAGPSTPSDYTVLISATPDAIPADGESESLVNIYVVDRFGEPVSGEGVFLSTTMGTLEAYEYNEKGEWETADVPRTSGQGRVYAYLTSAAVYGTAEITALVEDAAAKVYVRFM